MLMEQITNFIQELHSKCDTRAKISAIYKKCKYSVSKIEAAHCKPFEKEKVAQLTFNKHFNNPESQYYHMSVAEIIDMWTKKAETGANNGKALDNFIGLILDTHATPDVLEKYKSSIGEVAAKKCEVFEKFYKENIENKLTFLTREKMLFDEETGVVGRFDAMFMAGEKLLLVDWKNTEKISVSNDYEKLKGPLYNYDASDLNKYTIQVYLYTYILRKVYKLTNVKIIPLIIQIGTEEYMTYVPQIPYSDELIEDMIKFAINEINNKTNNLDNG